MHNKAILFDFDGVIADSERLHYQAEKTLLKKHGAQLTDEAFENTLGKSLKDCFDYYKKEFGLEQGINKLLEEHDKILKSLQDEIQLVNGFLDFLNMVKGEYELGIASSGNKDFITSILRKHELLDTFGDKIVTADMVEHGKPAPDLFLEASRVLNMPSEKCIVIEDSINGLKAALAAKMCCVYLNQVDCTIASDRYIQIKNFRELSLKKLNSLLSPEKQL